MAKKENPSTIAARGIRGRGPYRSVRRPTNGVRNPDVHVPAVTQYAIAVRSQPVSSMIRLWIPPMTSWADPEAA